MDAVLPDNDLQSLSDHSVSTVYFIFHLFPFYNSLHPRVLFIAESPYCTENILSLCRFIFEAKNVMTSFTILLDKQYEVTPI